MNERLREALRRKIARHNRLVTISTAASVLAVLLMWVALYFLVRWFLVFGATVVKGVEAEEPQQVDRFFWAFAAVELVGGWLAQRAGLYERWREQGGAGLTVLEICLLPARATFGTIQNFRNHLRLGEDDLCAATDFLERVVRAGKLVVSAVPVDLPDAASRERILHALTLLDLIYLREGKTEDFYTVADPQRLVPFLQTA